MNVAGETLTAWGRVTGTREQTGFGIVDCEVGIRNEHGDESTPGTAVGVLRLAGGKSVPYPFLGLGNG
jgi:acyl dehydratase